MFKNYKNSNNKSIKKLVKTKEFSIQNTNKNLYKQLKYI